MRRWKIRGAAAVFFLVLALPAAGQKGDPFRVYPAEEEGRFVFFADNDHVVPVQVSVSFPSLTNLEPSTPLPYRGLVPAKTSGTPLFSLRVKRREAGAGYRMRVNHALGDPAEARPDPDHLYLLPFRHGSKHRVTQGHGGAFSHRDENLYALDFDLDEGSPVTAARSGLVAVVKADSSRGGPSAAYIDDGNHILILHRDGTFGNYVHLRQNGALVSPGDRVTAGQIIGYSGNTGVSSGPHLHFDVRVPRTDGTMPSITVRFLAPDGGAVEPREGGYYYAFHPGNPPFPVVYGQDLTEEDFAGHRGPARTPDRVELRFHRVDGTYVVFVSNGFSEPRRVTVGFSLQGLGPSRPLPVTLDVPAGTERFLLLLKADPRARSLQYSYTIRHGPLR